MTLVTRYNPRLQDWPDALELRMVVLSDIHSCSPWMTAARLHAICAEANALRPDIVLLL